MSATIHGLDDLVFAIPTDESGLVVQRLNVSRRGDKREIKDKNGDYAAVAAGYGLKGELSIQGFVRGSGITSDIGATLTVANIASLEGNGVDGTTVIMDGADGDLSNEDFKSLNVKGSMYNFS